MPMRMAAGATAEPQAMAPSEAPTPIMGRMRLACRPVSMLPAYSQAWVRRSTCTAEIHR